MQLHDEFINFFIKHGLYDERTFNYLKYKTTTFDYREEEKRPFIGYSYSAPNNILTEIEIFVPIITDYKTLLINIYVYTHAIILYKQMGKKIENNDFNCVLPMLYEKIYLLENPREELEEYLTILDDNTRENGLKQHKVALNMQDELLDYYKKKQPNFQKLERKVKRLSRKYK